MIAVPARTPVPGTGDEREGSSIRHSRTTNARGGVIGGGVYVRHIEALESKLKACLSATLADDGETAQLVTVACDGDSKTHEHLPSQWLFTQAGQIVLFDRDATPHLRDFRNLNNNNANNQNGGTIGSAPASASSSTDLLQCLSLRQTPAENGDGNDVATYELVLEHCASLSDTDRIGLQQWDFASTRQTSSLLHDRAFARYDFDEFKSREIGSCCSLLYSVVVCC